MAWNQYQSKKHKITNKRAGVAPITRDPLHSLSHTLHSVRYNRTAVTTKALDPADVRCLIDLHG